MSESHPYGEQQLVGYSDITVTVTKEEDTDKENRSLVMVTDNLQAIPIQKATDSVVILSNNQFLRRILTW